jgi:DNA replicative helicase MCM subunit Mcm2 (Cdc46/Mcm family)
MPVVAAVSEALATADSGPIVTPEQEVPDKFDRRIPKFQEVLDGVTVTETDVEAFEDILAEYEATEYWADYIAPTVQHRPRAKRAILCMLASPNDSHGTKGRTNAIIYGPPGTGKTAFKNFLVEEFGAYSIDGARVSQADLTYNKRTDEDGLLVRAHRGLAVIEEADELDDDALGAALTALGESGQIEIREMRLPAEVRGVLLGNYQSRADIIASHSEALFNRFEFVLHFDRLDTDQRDTAIDWQYDHFREPKDPANTEQLKKYIAWVRAFDPDIPDAELRQIKEYKRARIDELANVREGISILTVAYTIARLNHRDLCLSDYQQAYELVAKRGS